MESHQVLFLTVLCAVAVAFVVCIVSSISCLLGRRTLPLQTQTPSPIRKPLHHKPKYDSLHHAVTQRPSSALPVPFFSKYRTLLFPSVGNVGQFGNQLFQVAFAIALQQATPKSHILLSFQGKPQEETKFNSIIDLHYSGMTRMSIEQATPIIKQADKSLYIKTRATYTPSLERLTNLLQAHTHHTTALTTNGYFQSLADIQHSTQMQAAWRQIFRIQPSLLQTIEPLFAGIPKTHTSIAMHIRLGDYRVPFFSGFLYQMKPEYYLTALQQLLQPGKQYHIFLVTDDVKTFQNEFVDAIQTIRNMPQVQAVHEPLVQGGSMQRDFGILWRANATVIANSTFSFWAAYLSDGLPHKQRIIAPWPFTTFKDNPPHDASGLIPSTWDVIYHRGASPPLTWN